MLTNIQDFVAQVLQNDEKNCIITVTGLFCDNSLKNNVEGGNLAFVGGRLGPLEIPIDTVDVSEI